MSKKIDSYHYCATEDNQKNQFYNRKQNIKEKKKTKKINNRVSEYIDELQGKEKIIGYDFHPYVALKYYEDTGYISLVNADRDIVDVYYYGNNEDEAYYNAIIDFEMALNQAIELKYRDTLNDDFSHRFLNGETSNDDYHGPFYFAELSLQDLKYHYKDQIPEYFLDYFNKYISEYVGEDYIYDIEVNRIVEKGKQKIKKKEVVKNNNEKR